MKRTIFLLVLALAPLARAQAPARDQPRSPSAADTAIIRGRVLSARSDNGVRKARVTLTSDAGAPRDPIYTDSEGRFEFVNLAPGRYAVAAWKSGWVEATFGARTFWDRNVSIVVTPGAIVEGVQLALERGAAISGRVIDEDGEPLVNVSVNAGRAVMQDGRLRFVSAGSTQTDDLGEYRVGGLPAGTFVVAAFGFPPPSARPPLMLSGPPNPMRLPHATYYPQSLTVAQATPVSLRTGDDVSSIDVIFIASGSVARVSGRVIDAQNPSARPMVAFVSDGNGMPEAAMGLNMSTQPGGEFSAPLGPGEYTVVGRTDGGGIAMQRVTVGQEDISGIQLVIANSARVSGRVVFEGTRHPPGRLVVEAWAPDPLDMMAIRADAPQEGRPTLVGPDDRFTLTGVFGRRELRVNQLMPGWIVRSITTGGRDVLDVPIDFKGGENLRDVVITVTDRGAELSGVVLDASGAPATGMSVLLFAEDRRHLPRRTHWEKPDLQGHFVLAGLPAGAYLVALAADVDDTRWSTPEYLESFRAQATRVTLADAEKKSITLQWSDQR
jgi:carboxypeptidase family protein